MTFLDTLRTCLIHKYADFETTAGRAEWAWFFLFSVVAYALLKFMPAPIGAFGALALFVPQLSVGARRLRAAGRTPLWMLLALVPIVGWIALLFLLLQPDAKYLPGPAG